MKKIKRRDFINTTSSVATGLIIIPSYVSSELGNRVPSDNLIIEDLDSDKSLIVIEKALKVQPVLMYQIQERREQASWRSWGDILVNRLQRRKLNELLENFPISFFSRIFPSKYFL
jgi:hypothetical protein